LNLRMTVHQLRELIYSYELSYGYLDRIKILNEHTSKDNMFLKEIQSKEMKIDSGDFLFSVEYFDQLWKLYETRLKSDMAAGSSEIAATAKIFHVNIISWNAHGTSDADVESSEVVGTDALTLHLCNHEPTDIPYTYIPSIFNPSIPPKEDQPPGLLNPPAPIPVPIPAPIPVPIPAQAPIPVPIPAPAQAPTPPHIPTMAERIAARQAVINTADWKERLANERVKSMDVARWQETAAESIRSRDLSINSPSGTGHKVFIADPGLGEDGRFFSVYQATPDGDCFFTSIKMLLNLTIDTAILRRLAVEYIDTYPCLRKIHILNQHIGDDPAYAQLVPYMVIDTEETNPIFHFSYQEFERAWAVYARKMCTPRGMYANGSEVIAIAKIFNINIVLWIVDSSDTARLYLSYIHPDKTSVPTVHLSYIEAAADREPHYDPIDLPYDYIPSKQPTSIETLV